MSLAVILDERGTIKEQGWAADMHGRIVGGFEDTPVFKRTAIEHNARIDEPYLSNARAFTKIIDEAMAETKPFNSAEVVPQHAQKSPGGFFSRMFSTLTKFFKEI